jgi:hypothetical protein
MFIQGQITFVLTTSLARFEDIYISSLKAVLDFQTNLNQDFVIYHIRIA